MVAKSLRQLAVGIAVVGASFGGLSTARAASLTVTGRALTHSGTPAAGASVSVDVWSYGTTSGTCNWELQSRGGVTDSAGNYSIGVSYETSCMTEGEWREEVDPYCYYYGGYECYPTWVYYPPEQRSGVTVVANVAAGEDPSKSYSFTPTSYAPPSVTLDITKAPFARSPNGAYFARRLGSGRYPIFIVEGFDPADAMKSDYAVGYLKKALVNGGDILSYLTANDYSIYLLNTTGSSGAASMMGTSGDTSGLAYQAMALAKSIHATHHAGVSMVMGGYSQGGLVARAGLRKWCNGDWAGYGLASGCNEVSLWWAGDSPLEGATVPVSVQRYAKDSKIAGNLPPLVKTMLNSWTAKEMIRQYVEVSPPYYSPYFGWITPTGCSTDCQDLGGCSSYDDKFRNNCFVDTSRRNQFVAWSTGPVTRGPGGARVPAIGFSVGLPPGGAQTCTTYSYLGMTIVNEYTKVNVNNAKDHHLYPNSAGGTDECLPGSRLNMLDLLAGQSGSGTGWWVFGNSWTVEVKYHPTFMASTSSLMWTQRDSEWKDYWYNTTNAPHSERVDLSTVTQSIPRGAGGFMLSWITEYLKGTKDRPVCGNSTKTLGIKGVCRYSSGEVPGNGVDDDGDDQIDEAAPPPVATYCYKADWNTTSCTSGCGATYCYDQNWAGIACNSSATAACPSAAYCYQADWTQTDCNYGCGATYCYDVNWNGISCNASAMTSCGGSGCLYCEEPM